MRDWNLKLGRWFGGQTLDRIAEDLGVRVTVRRNGALAVQFRVPANLVPPGRGEEVMIENEDAMLSQTSSSTAALISSGLRSLSVSKFRPTIARSS